MKILTNIIVLFALIFPLIGYGNAIEVSPIRVYLNEDNPVGTLNLTNKSQDTVYLQLDSQHWEQTLGQDHYSKTHNIIISPPIITIAPGKSQLVRLALRADKKLDDEDTYRLYIQEIPRYQTGHVGISFNLRLGIPIFVEPHTLSDKNLQWAIAVKHHMLDVSITNVSHYHCQLVHLTIANAKHNTTLVSQNTFIYLLPKQVKHLVFPLKTALDDYVNVEAKSDWGPMRLQVKT
jgi:fimbrial chaperone protein